MTVADDRPGFTTTIEALCLRTWLLGRGHAPQVVDQFTAEDFQLVVDDHADVHIASRDGRFYLGWFPEGRPGDPDVAWTIAVSGTATVPGYRANFSIETPAAIVAATVGTVLATAQRT